jgi:predicted DNA-binding transcriptional regulator YafY
VQAWCQLRQDYRLFRLRRIVDLKPSLTVFQRQQRLAALPEPVFTSEPGPASLEIHLPNPTPALLAQFSDAPQNPHPAGGIRISLAWPIDTWLITWLAGQAPDCLVLTPESLRNAVCQRIESGFRAYQKET